MREKLPKDIILRGKGFTLIELLVVLGILGILAIALLAAINPVEQLNKAQDASLKNIATEFVNANVQYYSVNNALSTNCNAASGTSLKSLNLCIQDLVTAGELKSSFTDTTNYGSVYATVNAAGTGVIACFKPQSNAVKGDPNTKYTQSGAPTCVTAGTCYWCAQ